MDTIPANTISVDDVDKRWAHKGQYMGKLLNIYLVGRVYDPDPVYVFEHGTIGGLGLFVTEINTEVGGDKNDK